MKKILTVLLCVVMVMSMAACNKKETGKPTEKPTVPPVTETVPEETTENTKETEVETKPEATTAPETKPDVTEPIVEPITKPESAPKEAKELTKEQTEDVRWLFEDEWYKAVLNSPFAKPSEIDINKVLSSCQDMTMHILSDSEKDKISDKRIDNKKAVASIDLFYLDQNLFMAINKHFKDLTTGVDKVIFDKENEKIIFNQADKFKTLTIESGYEDDHLIYVNYTLGTQNGTVVIEEYKEGYRILSNNLG